MISDLYEILRYNPNLPLQSIVDALGKRGHRRASKKNTRQYMEKDPNIKSVIDTKSFSHRPTVYYLKEEKA
tara:strand:+ start:1906 stop:2118 length:213 start_codon:yes stop_codon:yes gene_type:complete